jgi:hypothetical protein
MPIASQRDKDRALIAKQTEIFQSQGGEIQVDQNALSLDEQISRIKGWVNQSATSKRLKIAKLRREHRKQKKS